MQMREAPTHLPLPTLSKGLLEVLPTRRGGGGGQTEDSADKGASLAWQWAVGLKTRVLRNTGSRRRARSPLEETGVARGRARSRPPRLTLPRPRQLPAALVSAQPAERGRGHTQIDQSPKSSGFMVRLKQIILKLETQQTAVKRFSGTNTRARKATSKKAPLGRAGPKGVQEVPL